MSVSSYIGDPRAEHSTPAITFFSILQLFHFIYSYYITQLLHSQCSISETATVTKAYCRGCVQEYLTPYLCGLNSPPLPPPKIAKLLTKYLMCLFFWNVWLHLQRLVQKFDSIHYYFSIMYSMMGCSVSFAWKIRMSNSISKCFPGDKETPVFGWNDRVNRFWFKEALRIPEA